MSNVSVSPRSAAALKGWATRRAKAAPQMVPQPVQQAQCNAGAVKPRVSFKPFSAYRAAVRAGSYAWPGGYPLYATVETGDVLCCKCLKKHRRDILESLLSGNVRDGWHFSALDTHMEGPSIACDHCGADIESAYGEPDEADTAPNAVWRKLILLREAANPNRHDEARAAYREQADAIETPQTLIRSAQSIRDGLDPALVARYLFRRQKRIRAIIAVVQAQIDTATRYPSEVSVWNPGQGTERFIENPAECGLRFVGYSDELVTLRHTGHFTDRDNQDNTTRGVVYQMASRDSSLIFVPGYYNSIDSEGAALLDFTSIERVTVPDRGDFNDIRDLARDCARFADGMAERAAESECDYQESWQAGCRYVELGTEYRQARAKFIEQSKALRHVKCGIREELAERFLATRVEINRKRETLFRSHGNTDAFREHLPEQSN